MTTTDQSCGNFNNVLRGNVFISTIETVKCYTEQFSAALGSPTKTRSGPKRTFQDPLLAVFVILPKHMTSPRKGQVSCTTGLCNSL